MVELLYVNHGLLEECDKKKCGSNAGCCYFLLEKKKVKRFVQCHVFSHSAAGRRPSDNFPVKTLQRSRLV